jgi:hypothetical protein
LLLRLLLLLLPGTASAAAAAAAAAVDYVLPLLRLLSLHAAASAPTAS